MYRVILISQRVPSEHVKTNDDNFDMNVIDDT